MAINTSLLVSAAMLQDYLVDKTTGAPLAQGTITLYQDNSRTTLKNWYYQTGSPGNYTYITLPNPLQLSAVGTITDVNGNDTIPFFYPFSEDDNVTPQAYYITVDSSSGTRQFTRQNFPFLPSSSLPSNAIPTFENYIINNVFWRNIGPVTNGTFNANAGSITINGNTFYYYTIAPSQHDGYNLFSDIIYFKNTKDSTETLGFGKFVGNFSDNVLTNDVTPEFYLNLNCTGAGTETSRYVQFPIQLHVNNLSGYKQASASIWAQNVGGGASNQITLKLFQFLGTGVTSPSAVTIDTITTTPTWTKYSVNFPFPTSQNLTLGNGGDDGWFLQVGFPTATTCNINIAKPSIYLSQTQPTDEFQNYDYIESIINSPRTGDIRTSLNTFSPFGWVEMNDGTIGNSSSGGTARHDTDTWPLFYLIWSLFSGFNNSTTNTIAQMFNSAGTPVGYGASAYADFSANNRIALTKMMGRVIMGTVTPNSMLTNFNDPASGSNSGGNLLITTSDSTSFYNGMPVIFVTTGGGSLPDAIDAKHVYYVSNINTGSHNFNLSTSFSNAMAGTVIAYGATNGTTFNAIGIFEGTIGGEYAHSQLLAELASHNHTLGGVNGTAQPPAFVSALGTSTASQGNIPIGSTGSGTAFNIVQPTVSMNMFIKL
jgi:hypothetical protein